MILAIMATGYGAWCRKKKSSDSDTKSGSSGGSNGGTPSPTATAIAAGGYHTLALLSDDTIKTWGRNDYGQLGDGTVVSRTVPTSVSGLTGVTAIGGGVFHTAALLSDGTIRAWGPNSVGQLGDGTNTQSSTPVPVSNITTATAIACDGSHTVALLQDGTIQSWGENDYGQLGNGTTAISSTTPVPVSSITTATAIACGTKHTVALLEDGTLQAWGANMMGQLGNGTTAISSTTPVPVSGITTATAIACGRAHTIALLEDGTIMTWGWNNDGQLGNGTVISSTTPVPVSGITTATAIAAGEYHTVALLSDGTIQTWGANGHAQLGNGTVISSTVPTPVTGITTAVAIASGEYHAMALLSDKTIQTWGWNKVGELGDGSTIYSSVPIWVSGFSGSHNANRPPILIIGPKTGDQSQLLSFTISAIDQNGDSLTYSASGLPAGATFDPATKTFNWTPGSTGSYSGIKFTVTDQGGLSDDETIEITVVASSPPYDVTFIVLDDVTREHLTDLSVNCFSGWSDSGLDSPITHSYSAGNYTTLFFRINYSAVAQEFWDADGHKTFILYMEKSEP